MVANDPTNKIELKTFHCEIQNDHEAIAQEEAGYQDLPVFYDFKGKKDEVLRQNFLRINKEIEQLIKNFK